jgi:hypothetical protein
MALSEETVKLVEDATTLTFNALGLVPSEEYAEAQALVIAKVSALEATAEKPQPKDVVIAFVNTLDDVAHETGNSKFISIMDIVDKIANEILDGSWNLFKGISEALKLKKAAKAA